MATSTDSRREQMLAELWAMTPAQRIEAMNANRLSFAQLRAWTARRPHEVPAGASGEFVWIERLTPEYAEAEDAPAGLAPVLPLARDRAADDADAKTPPQRRRAA